jgi:hypothetical protein
MATEQAGRPSLLPDPEIRQAEWASQKVLRQENVIMAQSETTCSSSAKKGGLCRPSLGAGQGGC